MAAHAHGDDDDFFAELQEWDHELSTNYNNNTANAMSPVLPTGGIVPGTHNIDDADISPALPAGGVVPSLHNADVAASPMGSAAAPSSNDNSTNDTSASSGTTVGRRDADVAQMLAQMEDRMRAEIDEHNQRHDMLLDQMELMELEHHEGRRQAAALLDQHAAANVALLAQLEAATAAATLARAEADHARADAARVREAAIQAQANASAELQLFRLELAAARSASPAVFASTPQPVFASTPHPSPGPHNPSPVEMRGAPDRSGTSLLPLDRTRTSSANRQSLLVAPVVRLPQQPPGVQSMVIAQPPSQPTLTLDFVDPLRAGHTRGTLPPDPRPSIRALFQFHVALTRYRSHGGTVAVRALWPQSFQTYLQSRWEHLSTPRDNQLDDDTDLLTAARHHLIPHAGSVAVGLLKQVAMSKLSQPDATALTKYVEDFRMYLDLFTDMPEDQRVAQTTIKTTFIAGLQPIQLRDCVDTWYKALGKNRSFDDVVTETRRLVDDFESKARSVMVLSGSVPSTTATPATPAGASGGGGAGGGSISNICALPGCRKPVGITDGRVYSTCSPEHFSRVQELRRQENERIVEDNNKRRTQARVLQTQTQEIPICKRPGCTAQAARRLRPREGQGDFFEFCSFQCVPCHLCNGRGHHPSRCPTHNGAAPGGAAGGGAAGGGGGWGRGGRSGGGTGGGGRGGAGNGGGWGRGRGFPPPGGGLPGQNKPPARVVTCYRCGGEGHRSKDCSATPLPRSQQIAKSNMLIARAFHADISAEERAALADDVEDVISALAELSLSAEPTPTKPAPPAANPQTTEQPDTRLFHLMMQQIGDIKGELKHMRENN